MHERALQLVFGVVGQHDSRWQVIVSIAAKAGRPPQTLNEWVRRAEIDSGKQPGISSEMSGRLKALDGANRQFRVSGRTCSGCRILPVSPPGRGSSMSLLAMVTRTSGVSMARSSTPIPEDRRVARQHHGSCRVCP